MEKYNIMVLSGDKKSLVVLKNCVADIPSESELYECTAITAESSKLIKKKKIDLLFFDVDAFEKEAISFLHKINDLQIKIVIVSSSSTFAMQAIQFESVTGYLLRPLLVNNVKETIQDVLRKIMLSREFRVNGLHTEEYRLNFIAVSSVAKIDFVKIDDILFCEADGRYTTFFLENGKTIVSSKNLGGYEKILANKSFFRIHHRYLVNLEKVEKVDKAGGNYCMLSNEKSLPIAKRKQELLIRFLRIK